MHDTSRPALGCQRDDVGGAAGVDALELVDPARVDHACGVDHIDVAVEPVEERGQRGRISDVTDDGFEIAGQRTQPIGLEPVRDQARIGPVRRHSDSGP